MTIRIGRQAPVVKEPDRVYSPELLARIQALLAELADLHCALEKDLAAAKISPGSEPARLALIKDLQRRHGEHYARIDRELSVLKGRLTQNLRL